MAKVKTLAYGAENHDLCFDKTKSISMVDGIDAYAQIINCKMRTIIGELPLNKRSGIPYLQTIFKNKETLPIWIAEVQKAIESIDFVVKVSSFTTELEDGVLSYTSLIITDLGGVNVYGSVSEKNIYDAKLQDFIIPEMRIGYTIKFVVPNFVDKSVPSQMLYEGDIVKLPTLEKSDIPDGYDFLGWYMDPGFRRKFSYNTMPASNIVLYAKVDNPNILKIDTSKLGNLPFYLRLWYLPEHSAPLTPRTDHYNNPTSQSQNACYGFSFNSSVCGIKKPTDITGIDVHSYGAWDAELYAILSLRNEDDTEDEEVFASVNKLQLEQNSIGSFKFESVKILPNRIYRLEYFKNQDGSEAHYCTSTAWSKDDYWLSSYTGEDKTHTGSLVGTANNLSINATWCNHFALVTSQDSEYLEVDWGDGTVETNKIAYLTSFRDVDKQSDKNRMIQHTYKKKDIMYLKIRGRNCASFKIGKAGPSSIHIPEYNEEYPQGSKDATIEIVRLSSNIKVAFRMFAWCECSVASDFRWPDGLLSADAVFEHSKINRLIPWNESIISIRYAYANPNPLSPMLIFNNPIPVIPKSVRICDHAFYNNGNVAMTNKPDEMTWDEYFEMIMPNTVLSGSNRAGYVTGTHDSVSSLYTAEWGGTRP